jgi:peptidoglycan hydrolase-like protein with peptidoglycan-binding domain
MRFALTLLVAMTMATSAAAQQPPVPAAKPAAAKPTAVKRVAAKPAAGNPLAKSYAALPEAERMAIQNELIWTGDFNGTAASEFGERAVTAVKAFQKRQGGKETGVLNLPERALLAGAAKRRQDAVGWRMLVDPVTGSRLAIAGKLTPQTAPIPGGTRWTSARGEVQVETFRVTAAGTTLQAVHEAQRKLENRKLSYNLLRPDFFVLSGLQGLKKFYTRAQLRGDEVRGFTVLYDQAVEGTVDPVAIAMSSAFNAFPTGPLAAPVPRRKVEYATGVAIDALGYVVTTHEATDACQTITLAGLGPADRIATDKPAGLALLRAYGARDLRPLDLGDTPAITEAATLVGIADPQLQPNGAEAKVVPARVIAGSNGRRLVEPPPSAGFSGAALVGRDGKLAGIVDLRPQQIASAGGAVPPTQALLISADVIRALAQSAGAPLAATHYATDPKDSVRRVICVRK